VRKTKPAPYQPAVAKRCPHLFRRGVGGDIEVLGFPSEQKIAYTTADQIRLIAGFFQAIENFNGIFADIRPGDIVLRSGNDDWVNDVLFLDDSPNSLFGQAWAYHRDYRYSAKHALDLSPVRAGV
jgi:hypothetical protein